MTIKTLKANAMNHQADYARKWFHVEVDADVTLEDVRKPGFWMHHVRKLNKNDIIEVLGDGWEARLRVIETGLAYVATRLLFSWKDEEVAQAPAADEVDVPDGYVVDHTPRTRWRARMVSGEEISRNQPTKQAAADAARAHANKLGTIAA